MAAEQLGLGSFVFSTTCGELSWIVSCRFDGQRPAMIYFYRREGGTRTCETRLEPDGPGYELIVTEGRHSRVEHFDDIGALVDRECELRYAWLLNGWRTVDPDDELDENY
jgi:hypothetical protein